MSSAYFTHTYRSRYSLFLKFLLNNLWPGNYSLSRVLPSIFSVDRQLIRSVSFLPASFVAFILPVISTRSCCPVHLLYCVNSICLLRVNSICFLFGKFTCLFWSLSSAGSFYQLFFCLLSPTCLELIPCGIKIYFYHSLTFLNK